MNFFVNKNIRDTKRIYPMQERSKYLRYDMNENPEGLPKDFIEMVKKRNNSRILSYISRARKIFREVCKLYKDASRKHHGN